MPLDSLQRDPEDTMKDIVSGQLQSKRPDLHDAKDVIRKSKDPLTADDPLRRIGSPLKCVRCRGTEFNLCLVHHKQCQVRCSKCLRLYRIDLHPFDSETSLIDHYRSAM